MASETVSSPINQADEKLMEDMPKLVQKESADSRAADVESPGADLPKGPPSAESAGQAVKEEKDQDQEEGKLEAESHTEGIDDVLNDKSVHEIEMSADDSPEAYLSKARSDLVDVGDAVAVAEDDLLLASPGPQGAKTESWQSREATVAAPVGNVGSTGSTGPFAAQLNSTGNSSHGSGRFPSTGSKVSQEDRQRDPTIRSTSRASGRSVSGRGTPQPAWGVPLNEWGEPEEMDTKTLLKQICEASGKKGKQVFTKVEGTETSANAQPTVMSKSLEGDLEALKKLVDADPSAANSVDGEGYSGLHFAASYGHTECARFLLSSGSQVNLKASSSGVTPLHLAARGGHAALLSQLIEAGASVNDADKNSMTALHNASGLGTVDCAMALLDAGADLEAKDRDLWTCVHYAARFNNIDTVQKLLERGASPNDGDVDGWTPIHNCARNGRHKCLQLLLAKEGNILLQNKEGETPLHIAVRKSKMTIVKCMMMHAEKKGVVEELRGVIDKLGRRVDDVQTSAHITVRFCFGVRILGGVFFQIRGGGQVREGVLNVGMVVGSRKRRKKKGSGDGASQKKNGGQGE